MTSNLILAKTLDGSGLYGSLIHSAIALFFGGGALLIFLFLWKRGGLDMDEGPAKRMLRDEGDNSPIQQKNGDNE